MTFFVFVLSRILAASVATFVLTGACLAQASDSPEALLELAERLVAEAEVAEGSAQRSKYEAALRQLDEIVVSFPESDLAVKILLDEKVGSIDPIAIRTLLEPSLEDASPDAIASDSRSAGTPTELAALAIAKCFEPTPGSGAVTFRLSFDASGAPTTRPSLIAPERPGPAERRLFRLGLAAIEDCAPYAMLAEARDVEVSFDPSGVRVSSSSITSVEETEAREPAPSAQAERSAISPGANGNEALESTSLRPYSALPAPSQLESRLPQTPTTSVQTGETGAMLPSLATGPSEADEAILSLDRGARREIQQRLSLLGFDPRGVDGVFGKGTRQAIEVWQRSQTLPATGYLDRSHIDRLRNQSAAVYAKWRVDNQKVRRSPPRSGGRIAGARYIDSKGCLRESDGRYVSGFKASCK